MSKDKKFPFPLSMQSQLIGMTSVLLVSFLVFITFFLYRQAAATIEGSVKSYVSEAMNQLIQRHDMILKSYMMKASSIVTNSDLQSILSGGTEADETEDLHGRQLMLDLFQDTASENTDILGLRIVDTANRNYTYGGTNFACPKFLDFSQYEQKAKQNRGKIVWVKIVSGCDYPMLLGMRDIIDIQNINRSLGTLYILVDWSRHRELFQNTMFVQDGTDLLITNMEGEFVVFTGQNPDEETNQVLGQFRLELMAQERQGIFELQLPDRLSMVTHQTSEESGWKFISLIPKRQLFEQIGKVKEYSLKIGFIGLAAAILCSVIFARKISRPVKQLVKSMTAAEQLKQPVQAKDPIFMPIMEMEILRDKYLNMNERIRELTYENYIRKINEQEANLQALQSQINPHFLYNTLDSLYWMLIQKNEKPVSELIFSLSNCLRYAIGNPSQTVPLEEELRYIGQYVAIQNSRFGGKIKLTIEVPDELLAYPVFKLILQPIVENAILHGLRPLDQEGEILITSACVGDQVLIRVIDNGIGMPEEKVHRLLLENEAGGLGVRNVNRRIKLTYGERFGLHYESELYFGTVVTVALPKQINSKPNEMM